MNQLLLIFFASLFIVAAAIADHRQPHYQSTVPKSYFQALHQLQTITKRAEKAARQNDLQEMHKASYDLEAAIEVMQVELSAIAKQVEIMHHASERGKKADAQAALSVFAPKVQSLSK